MPTLSTLLAGLLSRLLPRLFATGLLAALTGLLLLLRRIVARDLLRTLAALSGAAGLLTFLLALAAAGLALSRLTGLLAFSAGLSRLRLAALPRLRAGLALVTLSALAGLLARLLAFATRGARLAGPGLSDFALELVGQRIEFRTGELELLGIVTEHALRGAFDAATQVVDLGACALPRLSRLRQITFLQHLAGEVERLAAFFAFRGLLQSVVKVPRHPAAVQQIGAGLLHRVGVVLA